MSDWLLNAWYLAAWDDELDDAPLTRRILDLPIVLFREAGGAAAALLDRCPHRFAPLSRGHVEQGGIRCGYHGLLFDRDGVCVHSRLGMTPTASVRSFPLVAHDAGLWLWPGNPDRADPSLLPDFAFLHEAPGNRVLRGVLPMKADYQLGTDNLMDLSHIEFLHTGSFGGSGVIFAGTHRVEQQGTTIRSNWWMPDIPLPPGARRGQFPLDARVDHWLEMRWDIPALMFLEVGTVETGKPRDGASLSRQAHILTPAGKHETHYFWAAARTHAADDPAMDEQVRAVLLQAFAAEDKPMIEAVNASMAGQEFWSMRPLVLPTDAGGVRVRRVLAKAIRDEQAAAA